MRWFTRLPAYFGIGLAGLLAYALPVAALIARGSSGTLQPGSISVAVIAAAFVWAVVVFGAAGLLTMMIAPPWRWIGVGIAGWPAYGYLAIVLLNPSRGWSDLLGALVPAGVIVGSLVLGTALRGRLPSRRVAALPPHLEPAPPKPET